MRRFVGHLAIVSMLLCFVASPMRLLAQESISESGKAPRTVNVELIVDSSGSMAGVTDTGEIRVDAAKAVLTEVANAIPVAEGINVGLRVYGHKGDNTEATRALSCDASDLVVPVKGVDKAALQTQIAAIQPTGWTPIGESLKRAAKDFSSNEPDAVNAIVVLTDGIETCDGDPVAVARELRNSPAQITTHVIGFATTPEDQTTLSEIASAGGGQLFGATNASQLSSALFEILEQLDIVVGAGFVGGNAFSLLPVGETGKVSVVAFSSASQFGNYPVVVRNNTGQDVSEVKVSVTIRDGAGNPIAAGEVQPQMSPRYLRAGGLAIGHIYLGQGIVIPDDAQVAFDVSFSPAVRLKPYASLDFDVTEASLFENRVVGTLKNTQSATGENGVRVEVVCFDLEGNPLSADQGFIDNQSVPSGQELSYQVDILGSFTGQQCPAFLVAGGANSTGNIQSKNIAPSMTVTKTPAAGDGIATPSAIGEYEATVFPTQDPANAIYSKLDGMVDAAGRIYVSPSDANVVLSFAVAEFETAEQAKAAMPILIERTKTRTLAAGGGLVVVDKEGFQVEGAFDQIYPIQYKQVAGAITFYTSDTVLQSGNRVYLALYSGYDPEYVDTAVRAIEAVESRSNGLPAADGVIAEKLWAELPFPSEIPAGFVLKMDYVPVSFGPIPPT